MLSSGSLSFLLVLLAGYWVFLTVILGFPGMIAALFSKCSISDCSALGFQKISKELEARVLTFLGVVLHRD